MLNKLGWYYIWNTQFSLPERKVLIAFFLRTIIEYSGYFLILFHHHSIAMLLFNTRDWYPATLYFELIFCFSLLASFVIAYRLFYKPVRPKPPLVYYLAFFAQFICIAFYVLGLSWLSSHTGFSMLLMFGIISTAYIILNGYEKFITLKALLAIATTQLKYQFITQGFFFAITIGLLVASFCIKAAVIGVIPHLNQMKLLVIPILFLSFLIACYDCYLLLVRLKLCVLVSPESLLSSIRLHLNELFARVAVNIMIGVFLVKWYFNVPFLLQYVERWSPNSIANIVLLCGIVSVIASIVFKHVFEKVNIYKLFTYSLLSYLCLVLLITINLYYHHWVTLNVLLMALLYNFLNGIINRMVHYNYVDLAVNTLLLVVGSTIGIIVFSFLSSSLDIIILKQLGISSRPVSTMLVMLIMISIGCCGFYKMQRNSKNDS